MGYGNTPLKPGCRGDTPEGRESLDGAIKQTEGNLEWSLEFLDPEEIVEKVAEVYSRRLENKGFDSVSEKFVFLQNKEEYHREILDRIRKRRERMEDAMKEDELQASHLGKQVIPDE